MSSRALAKPGLDDHIQVTLLVHDEGARRPRSDSGQLAGRHELSADAHAAQRL
ncbi:hypothetical protein [Streptomyces sp. NPDC048641]|uniref:hypothetical protein n=1 Tax=unclassified Streptomyces TaxID=2593676 RepID=UPI0034360A7C